MALVGVTLQCVVLFGLLTEGCHSSVSISVPDQVPAVSGSCLVIPCHFTVLPSRYTKGKPLRYHVRLRYNSFLIKRTAFSSDDTSQVHRDFRGRTALHGDPSQGDCSVRIERLRKDDGNIYQVELKEKGTTEWKTSKSISITVSDTPSKPVINDPGTVVEGQLVTLNCTVFNSCPQHPPKVQWDWERRSQENSSSYQEQDVLTQPHGQGEVIFTSLSFNASYISQPQIKCTVTYPGKRAAIAVRELHIKFPPKDVTIRVVTQTVKEGQNALLSCSCKADPPVLEYHWFSTQLGHTVLLAQRLQTVRVYNVTRDKRFRCAAQNQIGRAESTLLTINVQYKPVIFQSSSCHLDGKVILCQCVVDSNPRSAVTWSINGNSPPDSYNTSVSAQAFPLVAVLSGYMHQPQTIACYAYNALGNDSAMLLYRTEVADSLLWMVAPVGSIVISLLLLSVLILLYRSRKTGRHVMKHKRPSMYPGSPGIYQDHMPLYINCTEVTHIYTNGSYQIVYQNCTPIFIQNRQRGPQRERRVAWSDRRLRDIQNPNSDNETAVYMEVL